MSDYIRARSDDQKEERLNQIKAATAELFEHCPFNEITLSTISEKLDWSRANLYKYVTTKEEIILEIASDKMTAYYTSLMAAFPKGNNFSTEVIAEVWAGIVNAHQDYMRYVSYLNPVIETNVTVERLAIFKKKFYDLSHDFRDILALMLDISAEKADKLQLDLLMYASAKASTCYNNPLVQEALKQINITPRKMDFYKEVKEFILMEISWIKSTV
ncbi:MAG: TetR/AcrR family transcriptional regulator [Treponemataceae bacterium]|nr:TetR/AcrR family transcriptional regulator [Treponemataceae bacterium]